MPDVLDRNALPDEPMTEQEIFDAVVAHAATMKRRAMNSQGTCEYRTSSGRACFIGALLTDDEVRPIMNQEWQPSAAHLGPFRPDRLTKVSSDFLRQLQRIHDQNRPRHWPRHFRAFAEKHDLTFTDYSQKEAGHV